ANRLDDVSVRVDDACGVIVPVKLRPLAGFPVGPAAHGQSDRMECDDRLEILCTERDLERARDSGLAEPERARPALDAEPRLPARRPVEQESQSERLERALVEALACRVVANRQCDVVDRDVLRIERSCFSVKLVT